MTPHKKYKHYWYCYAKGCERAATFKADVSNKCFITLCGPHAEMYLHTMGYIPEPITQELTVPKGWERIKQNYRKAGAQFRRLYRR